jgi:CubicO group peptidase (beta-lactamase class C family)
LAHLELNEIEVNGYVEQGFEKVKEEFIKNFTDRKDIGAACSVYVEGKKVVDLWGGFSNLDTKTKWTEDTLQLIFSSTKGITATMANILLQQGKLEEDALVSDYWPEFKQNSKETITVKQLLSHKAGLLFVEDPHSLEDVISWYPIIESLEKQAPFFQPGTEHGYHALTFGWLVGELILRAAGFQKFSQAVNSLISSPLNLNLYVGLDDSMSDKVSKLIPIRAPIDPDLKAIYDQVMAEDSIVAKALFTPKPALSDMHIWNNKKVFPASVPAANGICDARSLAKMYAACVTEIDGIRLLNDAQLDKATVRQTFGADRILFFDTSFGLGYMLPGLFSLYSGEDGFGHDGAGGSHSFGDKKHKIGFAYVMNKMEASINGDPRSRALTDAVYNIVGEKSPSEFLK